MIPGALLFWGGLAVVAGVLFGWLGVGVVLATAGLVSLFADAADRA